MPYVREKKIPGKDGKVYSYYQLVEGKRVDGKVRQRVIGHLGKHDSIEDARVAAAQVVPKESRPVAPEVLVEAVSPSEESAPPDILNAEDAVLRKLRARLRAAARRRNRKVDDIQVAAYRQGYTLTDADWGMIEEILGEAEELSRDADKLTDELSRRQRKGDE